MLLAADGQANIILLGGPDVNTFSALAAGAGPRPWPLRYEGSGGGGAFGNWRVGPHRYGAPGLGFLFLAPLGGGSKTQRSNMTSFRGKTAQTRTKSSTALRLTLVVAGSDASGFDLASSLFPLQSGLTLPDYLVVEPDFRWKGAGGVISAGSYSNDWVVSKDSGYVRPYYARR
eukprot:SAG31_NODE_137_length_23063_cov_5.002569_8_plen_173_part_00